MLKYVALLVLIAGVAGFLIYREPDLTRFEHAGIEIVDTPAAREQGLSGRTSAEKGMLFVFPEKGKYGIWMKDMLIPIDIVWLADDFSVIGSELSVATTTYPTIFYPPEPVRYILELPEGTYQKGQPLPF